MAYLWKVCWNGTQINAGFFRQVDSWHCVRNVTQLSGGSADPSAWVCCSKLEQHSTCDVHRSRVYSIDGCCCGEDRVVHNPQDMEKLDWYHCDLSTSVQDRFLSAFDLRCRLGGGREREPYAGLSKVTSTSAVGAVAGLLFCHPLTTLWTWWGRGMEVTGPVWRR